MRELTIRIRFTSPCLGSVKRYMKDGKNGNSWPVFHMPRTPGDNKVRFEASWWRSSLRFAADVMCRHHKSVDKISFDVTVDGRTDTNPDNFFKRYFKGGNDDGPKFVRHEAFMPGDIVGVNCIVPDNISSSDMWALMDYVGRFRGISPYDPKNYGRFQVISLKDRNAAERPPE